MDNKEGPLVDSWVTQFTEIEASLESIGVPSTKTKDYDWIKMNLHNYCDVKTEYEILKKLKELHGY